MALGSLARKEKQTDIKRQASICLGSGEEVVVGRGFSGMAAAVAAAHNGADTILLERSQMLGGVATAGLMASIINFYLTGGNELVVGGIATEVVQRLADMGAAPADWHDRSCPHFIFLEHPVKDRRNWEVLRERFDPRDTRRLPEEWGPEKVRCYQEGDHLVSILLHPFFFCRALYLIDLQGFMLALYDDPDLIHDMFEQMAQLCLETCRPVLRAVPTDFVAIP